MFHFTIAFDPVIPYVWLIAFALLSLVLFAASLSGNIKKATARLAFAVLLLLFLAQPQAVHENRKPLNDVVLVAVDKSLSQDFGARKTISARVLNYLQGSLHKFPALEVRFIDVAVDASDETKVFDAMEAAYADVPASQRGGVILLIDGQVTDAPSAGFLKSAPLHIILTGSRHDKDREIKILNAPGYSVIGETVDLKFVVEDHNIPPGQTANVTLNLPDGTTRTRSVVPGEAQTWLLPIATAGQNVFELSVADLPDELSHVNNRAVVNVQGVRNRLHVLLVSGEPYPGGRMWRDLLKADPGVDLVHFTILRSPDKIDATPPDELSLIAFPFEELFERKLKSFDLIIMDRFSLNTMLPDYYFQNMKNYVEDGGALLEISGPSYSESNSIFNTSLGSILPGAPNGPIIRHEFKPKITDLGKTHPVTMPLTKIPDWGSWLQQIPVTPVSGDVLMTGINGNPLLTLSHTGKGRVAQLTSDQIWLWARGYQGGGPTTELLRRIVHWLMKEPELDENALFADASGNAIHLRLRGEETTGLKMTRPDGTSEDINLTRAEDGWLTADIANVRQGVYKFSDGTRQKIVSLGDTTTPEFSNIVTTDKNLSPFVARSGGTVIWAEDHPDFSVREISSRTRAGGSDWLGIRRNRDSSVISSDTTPILPPEIMVIFALLAGGALWWLESRKNR